MLAIVTLCLLVVAKLGMAEIEILVDVHACIDNDALAQESFAVIEDAIKISKYTQQSEKLKALRRLEKHVGQMRPIIMSKGVDRNGFADCGAVKKSGAFTSGIYTIVPPGSTTPIEVYCDMDTAGGGWTVFQRRVDGVENFNRESSDYAQGFGDKEREFWLGNDALKQLTTAGNVDLRVDMWDWNGNYRHATYRGFRISGEDYTMSFNEDSYRGDAGDSLAFHNGMGFTTRDHDVDQATGGNCAIWLYSGWWFNYCHRANLNGVYKNEIDAVDGQEDQGIQWVSWKGKNYSLKKTEMKLRRAGSLEAELPKNCAEVLASGETLSGVYTVATQGMSPVEVYCDMDTEGGGWTVFQKRENGLVNFNRDSVEYSQGFGEPSDEFWLGNFALRNMTDHTLGAFELRVDMWDWNYNYRYAKYQDFSVTGDEFNLNIGEYSGDAGDSLTFHNGMGFTTRDHDVDQASGGNCAIWLYSGWWFNYCHRANLNGVYKNEIDAVDGQEDQGIQWVSWKGKNYSLKRTEMKFRPL